MARLFAHGVLLDLEVWIDPTLHRFAMTVPTPRRSCAYTVLHTGGFYDVDPGIQVAQFDRDEKVPDTYHLTNQPRPGWTWVVLHRKLRAIPSAVLNPHTKKEL